MKYLIQFVAGTRGMLLEALAHAVDDFKPIHEDDSSLVFESSTRIEGASRLPFANNVFVVLASTPRKGFDASLRSLASRIERVDFPRLKRADRGFRVMAQIDGQLTPVDRRLRAEFEREIATFTQSRVEARGSCLEYWIVGRKNHGELMLCLRLPKAQRPAPEKGELSYELATLLVAASRPDPGDAFLDPFAGRGGLVKARYESPFMSIHASDIAMRSLSGNLPRTLKADRRVHFLSEDALGLASIGDGEIDVIVTDPPWGEFTKLPIDYSSFVEAMARSFDRVLHPRRGRFVVLGSRRQSGTLTAALAAQGFRIHATHGILVNGHPATVVVGSR